MISERVHIIADDALGNNAYLVDVGNGAAIVVDPRRDIDVYLAAADERMLRIAAVLETHLHADFLSGARELITATGAELYTAKDAGSELPHRAVSPGERLTFGSSIIEVLATPGHTPEHLAFLLTNPEGDAVFSGGSLIAGGAARTDLTSDGRTDELARLQFSSLRRLSELPEDTLLCPTHGGGSFCSATASPSVLRTIGEERQRNLFLKIQDEDRFVREFVGSFGSYPPYFLRLREINRRGPTLLAELDDPRRLSPAEALAVHEQRTWLIDARPVSEWTLAHPEGATSIELRPAFASWLGWVVPFGAPFVLLVEDGQLEEAVRLALRIGFERVQGWTTLKDWRSAGVPIVSSASISPEEASKEGADLVDVRQPSEFAISHLPGARHLELGDIIAGKSLSDADTVVMYCGHGERSATAVSLLEREGIRAMNLAGGLAAWRAANLPVTS